MKRVLGRSAGIAVAAALLSLAAAAPAPARAAAHLVVTPASALVDEPVGVRVSGLPARARVTLAAATHDRHGNVWVSRLSFRASRTGVVDTHSDMRLFSSLESARPVPAAQATFAAPDGPTPVLITARVGRRVVASGRLVRRRLAPGLQVTQTTLATEGFVGAYAALPTAPTGPAVLEIGGALPGDAPALAEHLASHGYRSLALAYWGEPGLPPELAAIPLEYFQKALQWLAKQPGVDPRRVVVIGVSRGGEAALASAIQFPTLVHGVVVCTGDYRIGPAYSPTRTVTGPAWTLGGQPLSFTRIPIEQVTVPVLLFGAGLDAFSPSALSVRELVARAHTHGLTNVHGRIYPHAGYGAGCMLPYQPLSAVVQLATGKNAAIGGTPAANEAAAASAWPALLRFLATLP